MFNAKNKNKGQVLVLVALSLVVFLGVAALAIDFAYFYHTRHQLQGAADAAALAGAAVLTCETDDEEDAKEQEDARKEAWKYACNNKAAGGNVYLVTDVDTANCNIQPDSEDLNGENNVYSENRALTGDIVVGNWDGGQFRPADGSSGRQINAVQVVARRSTEDPEPRVRIGNNPVSRFFGYIFNPNPQGISVIATAKGCFVTTPIAVNEYWMGEGSMGPGANDCNKPAKSYSGRGVYGYSHVYPNSFVRPLTGSNANVGTLPTSDCKDNNITAYMYPNGPYDCPDDDLATPSVNEATECKKGRPVGKDSAGRVLAIVGGNAGNNNGGQMYSLLDLNYRIDTSDGVGLWYQVPGFDPVPNADPNPSKNVVAGYIKSGKYPYVLPLSVHEEYQSDYVNVDPPYKSGSPYASTSFYSGQGIVGQMVQENFYDGGSYAGGKYEPGEKIVVQIYDGIVGGSGAVNSRTTIVGYARVTIFGYGNKLELYPLGHLNYGRPMPPAGPENTMYGYIDVGDSLRQWDDIPEDWIMKISALVD